MHLPNGSSLLISKSLAPTERGDDASFVGCCSSSAAWAWRSPRSPAAWSPRPDCVRWRRLTEAAERVARTDDLRSIPVFGSDELARLTEAFNMMLRALAESRERQARLVDRCRARVAHPADVATHQRRAADGVDGARRAAVAREEMAELRTDVIAQIEELSTLVGDLVDLTRDDAGEVVHEPVDMCEVIDRVLERVRRRRNDIEFDVRSRPGRFTGTAAGPVAGGAEPDGQRRQVESVRGACRCPAARSSIPRMRSWWCPTTVQAFRRKSATGLRAVLPLDVGAGDARIGSGSGHRQTGGAQTRRGRFGSKTPCRGSARRGHRFTSCCRGQPMAVADYTDDGKMTANSLCQLVNSGELSNSSERYLSRISDHAGKVDPVTV